MNNSDNSLQKLGFAPRDISIKFIIIFVIILIIGNIFLKQGIDGYETTSYDHPLSQLRYIKLSFFGGVIDLFFVFWFLGLMRRLILDLPALVVTPEGISYRGVWGPKHSVLWRDLELLEVVEVGTKGRKRLYPGQIQGCQRNRDE